MNDRVFRFLCRFLKVVLWRGQTLGSQYLPQQGPAIFLGNHSGPLGPIACFSAAGRRLYPWIVADMLDPQRCPPYLCADFVEKDLKLKPPLSTAFARALARPVVPLLRAVGCIPVHSFVDLRQMHVTLQTSLQLLLDGKCLLVFPEKPQWEEDPLTHIRRFSKGVLWLVELYYLQTGRPLRIVPFCVHAAGRKICFLPSLELTPGARDNPDWKEDWIRAIELEVRDGYRQLEIGG